ncbi:MAG: PEP-CTERM sorting domain-containing protein [Leptolyngbyaceae cyanobacterium SL_1_1]|nr:PEP-CTERM sorting domain-containing protein [Leptolyngbyaceae cyanobacterium RM1_1_2]NJO12005.1 PEP-CTERM sorting domain-containing protein [Leptolyngbyaceae cyanobacterium SL_1_1]
MGTMSQTLAIASVSALLGSISIDVASADAAKFATDFSVDIVSGDFLVGETFSGQVVYEDEFITGFGSELIDPFSGVISLNFTYVGSDLTTPTTYTEADDDASAGFPIFFFQDGELIGLNYFAAIAPDLNFQISEDPLGSGNFAFATDDFVTFAQNTGVLSIGETTAVPEPALLVGLVIVAGSAALRRQR